MTYQRLIEMALDAFGEQPSTANVVVLHPQFRQRNALMHALAARVDCKAVFVTLDEAGSDVAAFWKKLAVELEATQDVQLPAFDAETAPQQLAKVVAGMNPLLIAVTAYDYADLGLHEFVARTASLMGTGGLFVLDGRVWPQPLIDLLESSSVVALPVSVSNMLFDYTARSSDTVMVEVRALGQGQVLINGQHIQQWDGVLPRALFFYFIDRGMTTRDEVFATFWPELSTREATNVFHVTKRKISEILDIDLTVYSSGFYRIAPHIDLKYDVVLFVEAVQNSAVAEPDEAEHLLEHAMGLYERDFLSEFDQPWARRRREELRATYADALMSLARLYEDKGRLMEALALYGRAFGAFPQREDLARAQMRILAEMGEQTQAVAVYSRLIDELDTALGVPPSPETEALADQIRT